MLRKTWRARSSFLEEEASPKIMQQLQEMLGELKPKYPFLKFSGTADTEHQICDFAEHNSIDLLIVIPKKHNLIGRLFKHSCSKQLVLQAHIPVMAVHDN